MKLFVSALEYSANVHLRYLLRELVRHESVELCGIFDEKIVGNLSLDLHSADLANFGEQQTQSLVVSPKFTKNHESQTENPSVVDSALGAESSKNISSLRDSAKQNRGNPPIENIAESKNQIRGKSICNIENIAVMGFIDVLKKAKFFLDLRKKCLNLALSADKILLMDSSSFNIPLAKRIKKRDKTKQIIYYILPQVWAWKPWRARAIEANCDRLAAILPFEVRHYEKKAEFVGHPLLDEIQQFRVGNSVLGMQFRTCGNFQASTDFSLVDSPKISTNTKATPQFLEFASEAKQPSLPLRFCESQNLVKNNRAQSAHLLKALSGEGEGVVREGEGSDFAIQAPAPSLKENARGQKGDFNADLSAQAREENRDSSVASLPQNDKIKKAQNDKKIDCHSDSANLLAMTKNKNFAESTNIFSFMPGSRMSEIKRIFPIFAEVKDALKARDKDAKFHLIIPQKFASHNLAQIYGDLRDFHISFDTHRSLFQSRFAFICSGTATLECALIGTPFVLGYKCRALEAFIARCFLKVKFIGLANILYEKIAPNEIFHTELIQGDLSAQNLLGALDSANMDEFLQKSLALRKYLKCGSASAVAKMLYGL